MKTKKLNFSLLRLSKDAYIGLDILVIIILLSLLIPFLVPYNPLKSAGESLLPPSFSHIFGTDQLGRDVFTRTFYAARLDIILALIGVSVPLVIGTILGSVLGMTRSVFVSSVWMIVIDAINAFPFLVLVIAIVAIAGPGVQGLLIGLAAVNWARYAKMVRVRTLTFRDSEFIQATRVLGYSRFRILFKHIIPNVFPVAMAYGLSDFVVVIIAVSGLSFLGAGVRPPTPEWGSMISEGRLYLQNQWWITVFPGLILSITASGVALLANGIMQRMGVEQ